MREKEENEKRTGLNFRRITWLVKTSLGICLILAAVYILLSPDVSDISTQKEARKVRENMDTIRFIVNKKFIKEELQENVSKGFEEEKKLIKTDLEQEKTDQVFENIISYNKSIYGPQQKGLIEGYIKTDAWEETDVFGTLQIPCIDVDMPLYVGTTDDNLALGAAVLEGTSLPVGGENTNSVISGHRGWKGSAYLKEIEGVSWGDEIIITNPWGTLEYMVVDMDIIGPNESKPLLIREGKDMLTIVTCHPYRAPRNLRYVVYAERVKSPWVNETTEMIHKLPEEKEQKVTPVYEKERQQAVSPAYEKEKQRLLTAYGSSSGEIRMEKMLRRGAGILFIMILILFCIKEGGVYRNCRFSGDVRFMGQNGKKVK